ncbi:oxidoreductase [Nocardia fusca]|uniref:Oxidoreductase n=1 Tax=Nocardia fusca TaxID=941183 RepID=A0ABV3FDI4_9NOCA
MRIALCFGWAGCLRQVTIQVEGRRESCWDWIDTVSASNEPWTVADAPDQSGRTAVVTGANTGIGLEIARGLARRGATVVLACRNDIAAATAKADIEDSVPGADIRTAHVDIGDLSSVAACARRLHGELSGLDLLINNAGVVAGSWTPTVDGFESDFGINFLGHFALTARLADLITAAPAGRIVSVGSLSHGRRNAALDFQDLQSERSFGRLVTYSRSKMAAMTFMVELQRRLAAAGSPALSVGAHPGGVRSTILRDQSLLVRIAYSNVVMTLARPVTQTPEAGARSVLRAALDPAVPGAGFYGPVQRWGLVGPPVRLSTPTAAADPAAGRRLWAIAEELTGVEFVLGSPHRPAAGEVPTVAPRADAAGESA